eukprot:gene2385-21490_t
MSTRITFFAPIPFATREQMVPMGPAPKIAIASPSFTCTFCSHASSLSPTDVAARIQAANDGEQVDGAIDCCGVESAVVAAIKATMGGGVVCLVGMGKPEMTLPLLDASCREVRLDGVFRYRNTYPKCIDLLSKGKVDLTPLLTHRFEFSQASMTEAFNTCKDGKSSDGKTVIKCMISIDPAAKRRRTE